MDTWNKRVARHYKNRIRRYNRAALCLIYQYLFSSFVTHLPPLLSDLDDSLFITYAPRNRKSPPFPQCVRFICLSRALIYLKIAHHLLIYSRY